MTIPDFAVSPDNFADAVLITDTGRALSVSVKPESSTTVKPESSTHKESQMTSAQPTFSKVDHAFTKPAGGIYHTPDGTFTTLRKRNDDDGSRLFTLYSQDSTPITAKFDDPDTGTVWYWRARGSRMYKCSANESANGFLPA